MKEVAVNFDIRCQEMNKMLLEDENLRRKHNLGKNENFLKKINAFLTYFKRFLMRTYKSKILPVMYL